MNLAPTAVDVKRNMARVIINEYTTKRIQLDWPKGNRRNQVQSQLDRDIYPDVVVNEVEKRWSELTEQQKNEAIEKEKERLSEVFKVFKDDTRQNFIRNNFRIIDYIFFGLAAITAWRIGAGGFKRRFT
jgi:outer membrane cobalamin receptor